MLFYFRTWSKSCYSLLVYKVSAEKSADSLWGSSLVCNKLFVSYWFSKALLFFNFWYFDYIGLLWILFYFYLLVLFIWVPLFWNSLVFLYLEFCFLSQVRQVFSHVTPFSVSSPWISIIQMLVHLMLLHESFKLTSLSFSFLFLFFFLYCLGEFHCHPLSWFILSLLYPVCCWTPLVYFSVQPLNASPLWLLFDTFLYFLSLLKFSLHLFFPQGQLPFLWLSLWTFCQVNYLSLSH